MDAAQTQKLQELADEYKEVMAKKEQLEERQRQLREVIFTAKIDQVENGWKLQAITAEQTRLMNAMAGVHTNSATSASYRGVAALLPALHRLQ
jgi:Spy/CpxP family protein refolding chaperone